MKNYLQIGSILILSLLQLCTADKSSSTSGTRDITIKFTFGTALQPAGYTSVYVIWVENKEASFIQNLKVCKRLLDGSLTNTALPFWQKNVVPLSSRKEIDAVTSATQKDRDFTVAATIKDSSVKKCTVFFEIDRSFEPNDWFKDQPAVLYAADVDLNNTDATYELTPVGWTPNEGTANAISGTEMGKLQKEMRYITNHKSSSGFGDTDPRGLTSIVKKITVSPTTF